MLDLIKNIKEMIMKSCKSKIFLISLTAILFVCLSLVTAGTAGERPDYRSMVNKIGEFFNKSLSLYKAGNLQGAKLNAQAAYFEVFENMEGPIRINISAKKNFELEEEFVGIRNMIKAGQSYAVIERRINALILDLRAVIPELEGGFELVAETADDTLPHTTNGAGDSGADIEPVWLHAVEDIRAKLGKALHSFKNGDIEKAKVFAVQAQFDGYKNTLLETAVRRHVSQKKDYENNYSFTGIIGMIQNRATPEEMDVSISGLIESLKGDLPGLPVIEGAVSKKDAAKFAKKEVREEDWSRVTDNLFAGIEKAVALYERDNKKTAALLVQDTYFDVFEGSGMEAKIGSRDAGFKSKLEGHFSMIVGQMKKNVPIAEISATLITMKADFAEADAMLGEESESPFALFFYSFMIIIREGFEAILIITAIIAYLTKTGHRDKLAVIYNGCFAALVLSIITAVLVKWVFRISAASQEILEGITMLLATVVLFSASYWLISKVEAQKWMAYIKGKVNSSLSSGSLKALWFIAFLAVYREGAETVLFYQALVSDATGTGTTWILGGFITGCALLVVIYMVLKYSAVRLPIKPFFMFTGTLLYYMAFVFAGKGVMELIEGKLFEPSLVSWMPAFSFIGVYPYWQTLIPQMFLVLAALSGLTIMMKQRGVSPQEVTTKEEISVST